MGRTYRSDIYRKYRGTSRSLLFAAEFGAPADHADLRESCRYFLDTLARKGWAISV